MGERVDGHEYAAGAHAVLGSRPTDGARPWSSPTRWSRSAGWPGTSLDRLDATVLALTGSQGKTGTKDYLAARAGGGRRRRSRTAGNRNNEIGVPLTVLRADADDRRTSSSRWAPAASATSPTCARSRRRAWPRCSTSAPPTSASSAAARRSPPAKGEIVEALPADGAAVLNADDALACRDGVAHRGPGADLRRAAATSPGAASSSTTWAVPRSSSGTTGSVAPGHAAAERARTRWPNAAAAAAMAVAAGVPLARSPSALLAHRRTRLALADGGARARRRADRRQRRLQRQPRLDARRARGARRDRARRGRRTVAVLGEMLELGAEPTSRHREVGRAAAAGSASTSSWSWASRRTPHRGRGSATPTGTARWSSTAGRDEALAWVRQECRRRGRRPGQGVARRRPRRVAEPTAG